MDAPRAFMADKVKALGQRTHNFFDNLVHHRRESSALSRNPIEILKRLQREAFSDLMKLRDRQDKVERILSLYKTAKGSPFQEVGTVFRGEVDFSGALFLGHSVEHDICDSIVRSGIGTGIDSRFSFETTVRDNDSLVVEFHAGGGRKSQSDGGPYGGDMGFERSPLSMSKLFYTANSGDWLSAFVIPIGGKCSDVAIVSNPSHQGKGLTDISSSGPSLLSQQSGSAIGVMVKKSNIVASLAQFGSNDSFGTFGQLVCHLPGPTNLSVMGLLQMPNFSCRHANRRPFVVSLGGGCRSRESLEQTTVGEFVPPCGTGSTGSIALMVESELDEFTKIGGWVELKESDPKYMKWAVSMSDDSEDSLGWGMKFSGSSEGHENFDQFKVESYVKLNLGKRFSVKPGVAYIKDGSNRMTALMLRSNWSL